MMELQKFMHIIHAWESVRHPSPPSHSWLSSYYCAMSKEVFTKKIHTNTHKEIKILHLNLK